MPETTDRTEVALTWRVTRTIDEAEAARRGFYIAGFNAADAQAIEVAWGADAAPPPPLVLLHLTYIEGATVAEAGATATVIAELFNATIPTIALRAAEGSTSEKEPRG